MTTTANVPSINKENSIAIFVNTIKAGQQKGAFLIQEASILKKAIDFFNKDKPKPDFGTNENPEIVAVNLLIQGCQKVQNSQNNPLSIDDAATIFECFEYWVKVSNGEVSALTEEEAPPPKKNAKAVVKTMSTVAEDDESDEEEVPTERLITVKGKGKSVVH